MIGISKQFDLVYYAKLEYAMVYADACLFVLLLGNIESKVNWGI